MRRFHLRSFATLALAVGVATCSDTPIAAVRSGSTPATHVGFGRVAFKAEFSRSASAIFSQLSAAGIVYDSVRVQLRGTPDTTKIVKDTTVFFTPSTDSLPIDLTVPVSADGQRFDAGLDYRNGSQSLYSGHVIVQSYRPGDPPPPPPPLVLNYTGPGANAARISIVPHGTTIDANGAEAFSATAFDANNVAVPVPPIAWSVSDASLASITSGGVLSGNGRRGSVTVIARFGTISDQVPVTLTLPPSQIEVISGGGQTGKVGATLPAPAVVQVSASDGGGVAGVTVIFSAPAGGSATPTTVVTDAAGRAASSLRLGSATGPESFAATVSGMSVAIAETATAGDAAAVAVVSGGSQSDTVRKALAPLVVRVADRFNNPVAGATVSWTRTAGSGSLGAATSATASDGRATNTYTLGSAAGVEAVVASVSGVTSPATFSFTAIAAAPASIAIVSGDGQTGRANLALPNALVVRVLDAAGNPVPDASVSWSATNGTAAASATRTGADGQSSNTLTLGLALGAATATASISNGRSVTFNENTQPGFATQIQFAAQPTDGIAGGPLAAVRVAFRDAGGNTTVGSSPITIALGSNPGGATLSGTLTRTAADGIATFDDLKLDKIGSGYTLVASSGTLTAVTSSAFAVSAGSATHLAIVAGDNQSATVNAAVPSAPSVKVTDANNNPVAGVPVTFAPSAGSGSVVPSNGVVSTNAQGVATLTSWTLGSVAGAQTLAASVSGAGTVTFHATAAAGDAYRLVLANKASLQASATSGTVLNPQPVIQVVDQFGNAVPAGTMHVTASVTGSGLSLGGTTQITLNSQTGVGAFTDLSITGAGSTRLAFVEGTGIIKPDTSSSISVQVAGPSALVLDPATPTSYTFAAGAPPTVRIKAVNTLGATVAGVYPIHIVAAAGTITASQKDTVTDADGTFTVPASVVSTTAGTYTITVTSSAISGESAVVTFVVTPAAASKLQISNAPSAVSAGTAFSVDVSVLDQYNNVVSGSTGSISLALNLPTGVTASLGGATSGSGTGGVVHFTNLTLTKAAIGFTITATSANGYTAATTPSFNVGAGAATKYLVTSSTTTPATGSTNTTITATLADAFNNAMQTPTARTVNWTISPATGQGSLSGATSQTNTLGQATVTYTAPATSGGTATVSATDALSSGINGSVVLTPTTVTGTAAHMTVVGTTDNQTATVGTAVGTPPAVKITDASGNPVPGISVVFEPAAGSGSVVGGAATTNALGIAAATSWTLGITAGTQSVNVSSSGLAGVVLHATGTPGAAFRLKVTTGPSATATAGVALTQQPVVQLQDVNGNATTGGALTVVVGSTNSAVTVSNGNSVTANTTTGAATFSSLTLTGLDTTHLVFRDPGNSVKPDTSGAVSVVAGTATSMTAFAGTGQTATVNTAVTTAPAVKVTDANGNPVSGRSVTFTASAGAMVPVNGVVTTNAAGVAALTSWTLGTTAGTQTLTASSTGLTSVTISATATAGPFTQLSYTTQPTNGTAAATLGTVRVALRDASGNTTSATNAVTIALGTNPNGATLSGTLTRNAVNGIATFDDLKLDKSGTGYTLVVTSGTAATATSSAFNVASGSASGFVVSGDNQSAIVNTAVSIAPSVKVVDASNNPIANATVTFVPTTGNDGTVAGGTTTTNALGIATVSSWTLGTTAGVQSLTVSTSGVASVTIHATATAGAAAALKFTTAPSNTTAGTAFSTTVALVDAYGNTTSGNTGDITLALSPASGALGGTRTRSSATGSVTFADLTVSVAATGYTLTATSTSGYTSATSSAFSVSAGAARKLAFTTGPSNVTAGAVISPSVVVQIQDSLGNVVSGATNSVALASTPTTTLAGTTTVAAVNSNATFSNISVAAVGSYTLTASATGLTSATSGSFTVSTGVVSSLAFVTSHGQPSSIRNNESFGSGPQLIALDAAGNPVSNLTIDATVESATSSSIAPPGPATLSAFFSLPQFYVNGSLVSSMSQTTNSSGVADFSAARLRGLVQSFRVRFTARGTSVTLAANTALGHGAADHASCSATLPSVVGLSHKLLASPKLHVLDIDGNDATSESIVVETSSGGVVTGAPTASDAAGDVTIGTWTVGSVAGTHTVGMHGVTGTCSVSAARVHHIKLSQTSFSSHLKNGDAVPSIDATVVDSLDRAIEDTTFTIEAHGNSHSNKVIAISGSHGSDSHGKSSFTDLLVDAEAQSGATLDFSVTGASGITGASATFDVDVGDVAVLNIQGSSTYSVSSLTNGSRPTVSVKDHNSRNDVSGVTITWTLGSGCSALSLASATSTTTNSGLASVPTITGALTASCTLTASRVGATNVAFTLSP